MYFRIDDKLHSHVKAMRAGTEAMGLWALAASWSASQLTDGWVPEYAAQRIASNAADLANALVRAGLWHPETRDGEAGWVFHEWDEWQHTREYVEERRRRAAERMRVAREAKTGAQDVRANDAATSQDVRITPNPIPIPKNNPTARARGTVNPDQPDDFEKFWSIYPKKQGKQAAVKAWNKALKRTDVATIAAGLMAQLPEWQAHPEFPKYVREAATWLNQDRWTDETAPALAIAAPVRRLTLNQCDTRGPHEKHEWADRSNNFHCMGVSA